MLFFGAEGETRRLRLFVCFANYPIVYPCSSASVIPSHMDYEFSPLLRSNQNKKEQSFCCSSLAQKERLKGFAFSFASQIIQLYIRAPLPSAYRRTWIMSSRLSFVLTKIKKEQSFDCSSLAQKERLELSRRLPDLRP